MTDAARNFMAELFELAAKFARNGSPSDAIETALRAVFGDEDLEACKHVVGAVVAARSRQIRELGYDEDHDDEHVNGELAVAAAYYALPPRLRQAPLFPSLIEDSPVLIDLLAESTFDVSPECWDVWFVESGMHGVFKRLNDLANGAAMIMAEMQRLARLGTRIKPPAGEEVRDA